MKDFHRDFPLFSLCGLNCGLCSMYLGSHCPGCGGGPGNQVCAFARCSRERGNVEYCFLCADYPCDQYDGVEEFDSFITHRNQKVDMARAKEMGMDAYQALLEEKMALLQQLLEQYNDGRRKTLFCLATNLLEPEELQLTLAQLQAEGTDTLPCKERAALLAERLTKLAESRGIVLKLRKKPGKK